MKALIAAIALACFASSAAAQSSCAATAQEKKLAGAAKSSLHEEVRERHVRGGRDREEARRCREVQLHEEVRG